MRKKTIFMSLAMLLFAMAGHAADDLPALKVQGKNLVDVHGNAITLHGVMDTPNRYFNGWRWQGWKPDYSKVDVQPCLDYFEKLFTAITNNEEGAYCDVFRLHMDPCWTNDPNKTSDGKESGEADISRFSESRYKDYLQWLYIPLIKKALAHGLYVVVRPPGVCPGTIKVGDDYSKYLETIWSTFAADEFVKSHSGQVSIELANEPVSVKTANGSDSKKAMRDYFQPIVDAIRATGFDGIIWVPGAGWQSQYADYKSYPVKDTNFGYAVHCYPGWYNSQGGDEDKTNATAMLRQFLAQVPVVNNAPVIITEIDWSPTNPNGEGHKDEQGNWVLPNYGTWGTAKTSGFGKGFKYIHDRLGNISMTLSGTATYIDIDKYLNDGTVAPAFDGNEEACGKACFDWYKEWKLKQMETGIDLKTNESQVKATYYYDLTGVRVDKPQNGVYIIKQVLNDGKIRIKKVCYTK